MRRFGMLAAAAALCAATAGPLAAQEWPAHPVKVILPYGPGGTSDFVVRPFAERLSAAFRQQFVVEYRPGAGAAVGVEMAAKSPPDGYTVLISNLPSLAVIPLTRKVGYDAQRDLQPLGRVGDQIIGIAVNLSVPAYTLKELIELAKKSPGKLNYGSAGTGSAVHFAGEILKQAAGIDLVHVPYKSGGEALADLLAGVVQVQLEGVVFAQARAGKVRLLAVTTPVRYPDFPDVPAVREVVPSFAFDNWYGFSVPMGTPRPIVDRLAGEIAKIAGSPDMNERLLRIGVLARTDTPEGMAEDIRQQSLRYGKLIKDLNLKLD